jgi:hypothetical protein
VIDQPPPRPTTGPSMHDLVIADMIERKKIGQERYGTTLQAFNGRDALIDAYQEAQDLTVYLRQKIEEDSEFKQAMKAAIREIELAFLSAMPNRTDGHHQLINELQPIHTGILKIKELMGRMG